MSPLGLREVPDLERRSSLDRRVAFVSVVVPVRNEQAHLGETLGALAGQDYPADRYEILVVDGRSEDRTREIARGFSARFGEDRFRLLDNPARLSSAARNVGIREARGDLILIVDGHCQIDRPDLIAEVAAAFERSGADCLGRPQPLDVRGATSLQRAVALARASWLGHHPDSHIYSDRETSVPALSVAVAYRREVFDRVGLFDETFDACEDVELNHRIDQAGLRCLLAPRITVRYQPRATLGALFRQMARYGRGRVRLFRKHPRTFSWGSFAPAAWLLGVLFGPLMALVWPLLGPVYVGALAIYAALVSVASLEIAIRQRDLALVPRIASVFVTIHAGTGSGIVTETCGGSKRTGTWSGTTPGEQST